MLKICSENNILSYVAIENGELGFLNLKIGFITGGLAVVSTMSIAAAWVACVPLSVIWTMSLSSLSFLLLSALEELVWIMSLSGLSLLLGGWVVSTMSLTPSALAPLGPGIIFSVLIS